MAGLRFFAADGNGAVMSTYDTADLENEFCLPEYVDIILDLLNEEDAIKAAKLYTDSEDNGKKFVEKKIRRYTTRVYFHNRYGYRDR